MCCSEEYATSGPSAYPTDTKSNNLKLAGKQPVLPPHIADRCKILQKKVDDLERLRSDDKKSVSTFL
jgi:hypothetical protein